MLTDETKKLLFITTEQKIIEITKAVDEARHFLDKIEKLNSNLIEKKINIDFMNINQLLKYRLFIGIVILDFASAIRIYLNAKLKYEAIYSVRQIIVIINEGSKYMTKNYNID